MNAQAQKPRYDASRSWLARAERIIPGGSQTLSKSRGQFPTEGFPAFLQRGKGAYVWDVDGNRYLDYISGLMPVILGYDYEVVTEAVIRQLRNGVTFSLPHPLEVEVSECLVEMIPCAEMVRFGKNGSDVTAGAVRLARAVTGRDMIACCGYHGWQDWYIGTTSRRLGVPDSIQRMTVSFIYNDLESLERLFQSHPGRIAAVIMEPVTFVPPIAGFLEGVHRLTQRNGAILIFDEIVTGFRFALGGAQEFFGVTPDLACFGKAMANGFPLSALVGRAELMKRMQDIFFSFTFGGETVSLAAALATLREIRASGVIPWIWRHGKQIMDGVNELVGDRGLAAHVRAKGYPCWPMMDFSSPAGEPYPVLKALFQQEAALRGILIGSTHNVSFSHGPLQVGETLRVYETVLDRLAEAVGGDCAEAYLMGSPPASVFSAR